MWEEMEIIGLDVGFSKTRPSSGVARLGPEGELRVGHAMQTWESRSAIAGTRPVAVAAIDAPYVRGDVSLKRGCERVLSLGQFHKRCKPAYSHVPGTGQELRNAGWETAQQLKPLAPKAPLAADFPRVEAANIVEAFPNSYLGVCLSEEVYAARPTTKRGQKFDWLYDEWVKARLFDTALKKLGLENRKDLRDQCMQNTQHDERAALICLLTAAGVATGRYTAVGDPTGGYIFLPPWPLWHPWAQAELTHQKTRQPGIEVWVDGVRE